MGEKHTITHTVQNGDKLIEEISKRSSLDLISIMFDNHKLFSEIMCCYVDLDRTNIFFFMLLTPSLWI